MPAVRVQLQSTHARTAVRSSPQRRAQLAYVAMPRAQAAEDEPIINRAVRKDEAKVSTNTVDSSLSLISPFHGYSAS